jgi:hypothetical protein
MAKAIDKACSHKKTTLVRALLRVRFQTSENKDVNKMKALITETVGKAPIRPCIESKTTEH